VGKFLDRINGINRILGSLAVKFGDEIGGAGFYHGGCGGEERSRRAEALEKMFPRGDATLMLEPAKEPQLIAHYPKREFSFISSRLLHGV
jgi:hypothetical protein